VSARPLRMLSWMLLLAAMVLLVAGLVSQSGFLIPVFGVVSGACYLTAGAATRREREEKELRPPPAPVRLAGPVIRRVIRCPACGGRDAGCLHCNGSSLVTVAEGWKREEHGLMALLPSRSARLDYSVIAGLETERYGRVFRSAGAPCACCTRKGDCRCPLHAGPDGLLQDGSRPAVSRHCLAHALPEGEDPPDSQQPARESQPGDSSTPDSRQPVENSQPDDRSRDGNASQDIDADGPLLSDIVSRNGEYAGVMARITREILLAAGVPPAQADSVAAADASRRAGDPDKQELQLLLAAALQDFGQRLPERQQLDEKRYMAEARRLLPELETLSPQAVRARRLELIVPRLEQMKPGQSATIAGITAHRLYRVQGEAGNFACLLEGGKTMFFASAQQAARHVLDNVSHPRG
jgi:hypothetical protein